ncbi:MAG: polyketide synthase, partial [Thermoleophilaceae bacterium]
MSIAEPIAIIGLSCRMPQAEDPEALWHLLREGKDVVSQPPSEDDSVRRMGGVGEFDSEFFGISPREAAAMDPQQRLALELSWECMEDAGVVPGVDARMPIGVFLGATGDYADSVDLDSVSRHTLTGVSRGVIANRVSYALALGGPSLTVDTAQSSSLVAVHLACNSLLCGESMLALTGGVNVNVSRMSIRSAVEFGALSPDARCYTFDARANGYVIGNGGGVIALKRLSQAVGDGDRVHAVIRGSAVNNGGRGDALTVPSQPAQESVIQAALERSGVDGADVQYVELHGAGTPVGDPVEAAALGATMGCRRTDDPLFVGSIKTNVGHLEGAAGVAGLIKTALCVKQGELVPSLNFSEPNPQIPLEELGLQVVRNRGVWRSARGSRIAGVSSFGVGGTNAHVIVEEAPAAEEAV